MAVMEEYIKLQQQIPKMDMAGEYLPLLEVTERYVALAEELFGTDDLQYATALNEYAGACRNLGEYEKAETAYMVSLKIMRKRLGEITTEYATVLNNLAGMYRLSGQYEKAEDCFLLVKDIYEETVGKNHFLYASCLNNLGLLYQARKRYAEAEKLHAESLTILDKLEGNQEVVRATTMLNLASARNAQNKMDEVESLLKGAKDRYASYLGTGHPLYVNAKNSLEVFYIKQDAERET